MSIGIIKKTDKKDVESFFNEDLPNLPYNFKKVVLEYGIPTDILYTLITEVHLEREKNEIAKEALFMMQFYEEDKELTETTRALECENFHDY